MGVNPLARPLAHPPESLIVQMASQLILELQGPAQPHLQEVQILALHAAQALFMIRELNLANPAPPPIALTAL